MKKYLHGGWVLILVLMTVLSGCGGGGGGSVSGRQFAYVMQLDGELATLAINASGQLSTTPLSSVKGEATGSVASAAADPAGKFLYVVNYSSPRVSVYSIHATTGALTQVTGSPFATDSSPKKVVVDPTGRFVAVGCSYRLHIFERDQTTGTLSNRADFSFASGQELGAICFDSTGRYLYAAVLTGHIYVFAKNTESNTFTQVGSARDTRTNPTAMAINSGGSHLFMSTSSTTTIPVHPVNIDGSLGEYISLSLGAQSSSLIINGNYLYIAQFNGISAYSIANPALMAGVGAVIPLPGSIMPAQLVFDPSKKFLYSTGWMSDEVWGFSVNADGSLQQISGSSLFKGGSEIMGITTVQTGKK